MEVAPSAGGMGMSMADPLVEAGGGQTRIDISGTQLYSFSLLSPSIFYNSTNPSNVHM